VGAREEKELGRLANCERGSRGPGGSRCHTGLQKKNRKGHWYREHEGKVVEELTGGASPGLYGEKKKTVWGGRGTSPRDFGGSEYPPERQTMLFSGRGMLQQNAEKRGKHTRGKGGSADAFSGGGFDFQGGGKKTNEAFADKTSSDAQRSRTRHQYSNEKRGLKE